MKKFSLITALLLAVILLLTACSGENSEGDTSVQPTEAAQISEELGQELDSFSDEVIDADLTSTITLVNWPPETAAPSEIA